MKFEQVLQAMKEGKKVKRKAWDFNYEGYCTNQDLLADDWEIVGEEQPEKKKYLSEAMNKSKDKITKYVQGQMDKAFEEMSDNLKKSIAESIEKQSAEMKLVAREQVETNYYNTICSKDGYKIIYETNSRNNYEEIQEHIRQFIDRNNEKQDEETARKAIEEMKCKHKNENKASCSCLCSCGETDKEIAELKKEVERLKALVLYGKR